MTAHTVIGMTDGMRAARAETRRIIEASKGDFVAEQTEVLRRLHEAGLITAEEIETLVQLYRHVMEASHDKGDVTRAYFHAREIHDRMAANLATSPIALVVAGATLGAFEVDPGDDGGAPTVVVYRVSYGGALAGIGAGLGALLGGPAGGVLGGQIGGLIGGIIDDKKGDKKK
ncbi:hypothetical protein [Leifsonia aquatica]|uniref:hypothetical protein n=1 Tax=Leifsonia aquatica TaxID=144185 RepID=UPI0013B42D27|nr:hypothetical protein [Leifsonia aquatica]